MPLVALKGKNAQAEALYERSQAIREKLLGPEHPGVAESLHARAGLLVNQVGANRERDLHKLGTAVLTTGEVIRA